MEIEKLIKHMRKEAQDYRAGRTLGRAFADAEDVLDEATTALEQLQAENDRLRRERDAAVEKLSGMEWIDASVEVPPDENFVLALAVGKPTANIELVYSCEIASYSDSGWFLEAWPDWDQTVVSHWMPIPELPKVCGQ